MNSVNSNTRKLSRWARAKLREQLGGPQAPRPDRGWCDDSAATFVTLRWHDDGRLQGCIGTLEPRQSIADDVAHNVVAAALEDARGEPLTLDDVDELDVEVSVLSPLERVDFADEPSAVAALARDQAGVVIEWGARRATFLPAMWLRMPDARDFLAQLKRKAGLAPDFWDDDVRLWRYTVDAEEDLAPRPTEVS
jgi:AmmeMemoRadiSam system protein A